jgi:tellurite methyltransferase
VATQDRVRWDTVYRERNGRYPVADPLLFEYTFPLELYTQTDMDRRALDLACGLGQNGIWLASQGYIVDMMDISRTALMRARNEVEKRRLRNINLLQVDLESVHLSRQNYDIICVFRYLRRELFPQLVNSVRGGGRIIYETFNTNYLEQVPGFNPDFLLEPGEIASYFEGWEILYCDEEHETTQFVAQKPRL